MNKKNVILVIIVILFALSLIFPIKTNLMRKGYNGDITAIELKNDKYVFDIVPDSDNLSGIQFRFCTFDTKINRGIIRYMLLDSDENVIFDKKEEIKNIKTNEYISEYFDKQKSSKGKQYKFIIEYDEYHKEDKFGIWVNTSGTSSNYLENDSSYGLEAYIKTDVSNITLSWFILIAIAIYVLYIILEKE